LPRRSVAQPG